MSDIPQVAIDRAVEAVSRLELMTERIGRPDAEFILSACASVIAEAAYKEAKARIESLGSEYNPNWTPEENRAYGIGLKAALNALDGNPQDQVADNRAAALAAIDKEGETSE